MWRVSVEQPAPGRPLTVTASVRERADSLAGEEEAIAFVLRCSAPQLDAFITTRDQLESNMTADVRVRVESDSVRARDARWQATKANTGAFVPTGDLRDLIQQRLRRTETLRVTIATQTRGRVTYTFAVGDIRPALDALRDACPKERNGALQER
ncbi:MAG: hypothetical protein U5K74_14935 [Gemmatimonadaceae bacterium]|nr:hypothetical protein [Gemmatimonadaceae bacterium]